MQTDRGLAGSGTTLHDEALVERRADHFVLLGLDRRDDVAHLAAATALELGEQRVGHPAAAAGALRVGIEEVLVEQPERAPGPSSAKRRRRSRPIGSAQVAR